jgi:hypothetical protein
VSGVQGIRRVIDQLQLVVKKKVNLGPPQTSSYSSKPAPDAETPKSTLPEIVPD